MKFYKVKAGKHKHYGLVYNKGDVIESGIELDKIFRGKFEVVVGGVDQGQSPPAAKTPLGHRDGVKLAPIGKKGKKDKKGKKGSQKASEDPRGVDVTAKFPELAEEEVSVFRRGSWYHIHQGDDKNGTPINKKGLKKDDVVSFFKKWEEE